MFTRSQAIQQSHFLRAESSCAMRMSTVTVQSRYGWGSEGKRLSSVQPQRPATSSTALTLIMRQGQVSMVTFSSPLSVASSLRGCVQRQWPRMLMESEIGCRSRLAYRLRFQKRKKSAIV